MSQEYTAKSICDEILDARDRLKGVEDAIEFLSQECEYEGYAIDVLKLELEKLKGHYQDISTRRYTIAPKPLVPEFNIK